MASTSAIDTQTVGGALRAANQASDQAINAGTPTGPSGTYVAGTSTMLTALLRANSVPLSTAAATSRTGIESTVHTFDATEDANQTSLST